MTSYELQLLNIDCYTYQIQSSTLHERSGVQLEDSVLADVLY